jgi:hypothetical protein
MKKSTPKLEIPTFWTGKQAVIIMDFLSKTTDAIWDAHENKILDFMEQNQRKDRAQDQNQVPEDDLPF